MHICIPVCGVGLHLVLCGSESAHVDVAFFPQLGDELGRQLAVVLGRKVTKGVGDSELMELVVAKDQLNVI